MVLDPVDTTSAAIENTGYVTEPFVPSHPTASTPPLPIRPADEPYENPQVASLHAIFPDFDPVVLQSVLDSVGGDQDRAVDKLLGMSDPEYEERHTPDQTDQTELDEQLARRLMLEEQEQAHRRAPREMAPYQPRPAPAPDQAGRNQGGNTAKPDFQEVTETFNKIAESGKKTFSSLFSKVKAKVQEFDQSRNDNNAVPSGSQFSYGPSYQDRHSMMQQSYYDPNSQESTTVGSHVQGYDITPAQPTRKPLRSDSTGPLSDPVESPQPPSVRGISPGPQRSAAIDPSKLGLLPKRPVSLIGASPPPKIPATNEGDDLEYAENPFEDERRK